MCSALSRFLTCTATGTSTTLYKNWTTITSMTCNCGTSTVFCTVQKRCTLRARQLLQELHLSNLDGFGASAVSIDEQNLEGQGQLELLQDQRDVHNRRINSTNANRRPPSSPPTTHTIQEPTLGLLGAATDKKIKFVASLCTSLWLTPSFTNRVRI